MEKFVSCTDMTKKQKKEFNERRRNKWIINPVTRKPENPRAYNRNRDKKNMAQIISE